MLVMAIVASLGLLLVAYAYGSAPVIFRIGLAVLALAVGSGSYINHTNKIAVEQARLAAIEEEQRQAEEEENARLEAERVAEEDRQRAEEAIRQANEERRERLRQQAETERQQILEEEREERELRRAQIERLLPNSFSLIGGNLSGNSQATVPISQECMIDNLFDRRMKNVQRTVDRSFKQVHYRNNYRYGGAYLHILFFDDLDGGCRKSLERLSKSGYIANTVFNDSRTWKFAARVLAPGEQGSTEVVGNRPIRPNQPETFEDVLREGISIIEGFKRVIENR